jgi:hypothetical protein
VSTSGNVESLRPKRVEIMGQSNIYRTTIQSRRGAPAFAASQRDKILELLRQAGPRGISRSDLIFHHRMTQCGTRIFELEQMGYVIRHDSRPGQRYVTYVLVSEPLTPKPIPSGADWYTIQTGKPRPSGHPWEKPFSEKRMAQDDCFVLTPPEPRR